MYIISFTYIRLLPLLHVISIVPASCKPLIDKQKNHLCFIDLIIVSHMLYGSAQSISLVHMRTNTLKEVPSD